MTARFLILKTDCSRCWQVCGMVCLLVWVFTLPYFCLSQTLNESRSFATHLPKHLALC